ncbi:MAG: hypothetical protein GTN80_00670 [Nitrososphaeria archaeon]|nr:hypothetical protein [Nitrososphaeria archaeon]NIQ32159.1 hypothetical protein [Nitrososphaeria archaeon]
MKKKFRYKKVSPEVLEVITGLRGRGLSIHQIAGRLGLSKSTIEYWLNPEYREKANLRSRTRYKKYGHHIRDREKRREYQRRYMRERYRGDPLHRAKMKEYAKRHHSKRLVVVEAR